jgi:hypothetical protein
MKNMRKITLISVVVVTAFLFVGANQHANADVSLSELGLKEGDVVGSTDPQDFDLYIVNEYAQKRLFANPKIFGLYGHLRYDNVKRIPPEALDILPTSGLFMNCETGSRQVYALNLLNEDSAELRRLRVVEDKLLEEDPDFFKKVFCINNNEERLYQSSTKDYTSVRDVPVYKRVIIRPEPVPTIRPVTQPMIKSLEPSSGPIGTKVTIMGSGLLPSYDPPVVSVFFNGNRVVGKLVRTESAVSFTVPKIMQPPIPPCSEICPLYFPAPIRITPGTYNVTIQVGRQTSNAVPFTVTKDTNRAPVINGISGPTVLNVNETGTWIISAHDQDNDNLRYRVSWGDEGLSSTREIAPVIPTDLYFNQNTSFTHSYSRSGTYTPTFWVHDSVGNVARASMTVRVDTGSILGIGIK